MIAYDEYFEKLKKRAQGSKIYRKYQLIGLEIAKILKDKKHKSLYIKLAKEKNGEVLIRLAKKISENKRIKNPAAYFTTIVAKKNKQEKHQK